MSRFYTRKKPRSVFETESSGRTGSHKFIPSRAAATENVPSLPFVLLFVRPSPCSYWAIAEMTWNGCQKPTSTMLSYACSLTKGQYVRYVHSWTKNLFSSSFLGHFQHSTAIEEPTRRLYSIPACNRPIWSSAPQFRLDFRLKSPLIDWVRLNVPPNTL